MSADGTPENPADKLTWAIASNRAFIDAHWDWHSGRDNTQGTAEAVLNTPEMQAIKAYVNWAIHDTTDREYEPELPDSVIEWLVQ